MPSLPSPFTITTVETKFGKFLLRPKTLDLLSASPAYERRDVNILVKLINKLLRQRQRVLFLDIGSDFGYYSVLVGNTFRHMQNLTIHAFEPYPKNYTMLLKNIEINNLDRKIYSYNIALTDKDNVMLNFFFNPSCPGSSGILSQKKCSTETVSGSQLDTVLCHVLQPSDVLVIKIDVEGYEATILEGAKKILGAHTCYILVEDFVKTSIIEYLTHANISFIGKYTPYNSWWVTQPQQKNL